MTCLKLLSPAKVNLYLGVSPLKSNEPKHEVQTVIHMLDFGDVITITTAPHDSDGKPQVRCTTQPALPFEETENLAYRAARGMLDAFDKDEQVTIHIEKHIPVQAGLGGGSSNAATVLWGLAHLWGVDKTDSRILALASELGADVASFLYDGPSLLGGYGDIHKETFKPLAGSVVLIKPEQELSTSEAYQRFDQHPDLAMPIELLLIGMREGDTELVASHVTNNMELGSISLVPQIATMQSWLSARPGTNNAHMAGSGSCVFAIFDTLKEAQDTLEAAEQKGWWAQLTQLGSGIKVLNA